VTSIPISAHELGKLSLPEQKQMLGEALFPRIHDIDSVNAGKITGMLLELEVAELLRLVESHDELLLKVREARQVLEEAKAQGQVEDA